MSSSKKKKIVIIGPAYPYRGGNSLFVSHVYYALSEMFDVKIFNYKLLYPALLFPGTTQYDKSETQIKKAPNERLINSISPLNWINAARRIKDENADLVVFDWWHPFFGICHSVISSLIKNKYKNKILFITENFVSHEGHLIDRVLTGIGLRNASAFLALSDIVEKDLKGAFPERKIYRSELPIYDCYKSDSSRDINNTKAELGIKNEDKVLLFFGYVRHYKGLDILLSALPKMVSEFGNIKLLVVGEFYDNPKIYTDKIKELKIEDNVILVNQFVPNEEVGKYYSVSDLVILPYRGATQSGILNVAYGFSKPVLVTDVGGLAEFVNNKKTGLVVKPNSTDELFNGVKEFFALRDSVNFEANIQNQINENSFGKLPELFEQIITDEEK